MDNQITQFDCQSSGLTIVIPCFNEAESLAANLPGWIKACEQRGWKLILVDDGSTDQTHDLLRGLVSSACIQALRHPINRGYGAALKTGLHQVSTAYAATMDADGQHSLEHLDQLLPAMESSGAELIIGSRLASATNLHYRRLGKALIRLLSRLLFEAEIQDLNSGLRIYRTSVIQRFLPHCPDSMAFSDISALLHLNTKCRVLEVPVTIRSRSSGRSTINTMTAVDTVLEIVNIVMWFRPLRLLLPIATVVMLAGALWAFPFLLAGRGLSSVALLLLLGGLQLGILALLAEQFASIRRLEIPDVGYSIVSDETNPEGGQ